MKRLLSLLLCISVVVTSTVFAVSAVSDNPGVILNDTDGNTGYSVADTALITRMQDEGGVTLIFDVLVESFTSPDEGMTSQIAVFTGGPEYNYLSYDFTDSSFKAGVSSKPVGEDQSDAYSLVDQKAFTWEMGRWYEVAMRFNGRKAAIYLNGICVISTEFVSPSYDYLVLYPQYCTVRMDNIRVCAKDYNVSGKNGTVWAAEDFSGLDSVEDSSVWYFDTEGYSLSVLGRDTILFGDVNADGMVDADDLNAMRTAIVGLSSELNENSDIDVDGSVDLSDLLLLRRILAGYEYDPDNDIIVEEEENDTSAEFEESDVKIGVGSDTLDGSVLKFDSLTEPSYTFLFRDGGISYGDVALTFDVYINDIDESADFAGIGVWNSDQGFVGYNMKYQRFTYGNTEYPEIPSYNSGISLDVNFNEWNHFCFRRLNNDTFEVYVNGTKYIELTGRNYEDTEFLFAFSGAAGYIDNYQYYHDGAGQGLITDFSGFTKDGSWLKSNDGGYWIIGENGFSGVVKDDTDPVIGESVDFSTDVTTAWELANRCAYISKNFKTLYVMGCFGAPMNDTNKARYTQNHSYNKQEERTQMINDASSDTFGFDCVCLIKGVLWGWNGNLNKTYGGAVYQSNGVPDINADKMITVCSEVTTDFSSIEIGEVVWMEGHIGVYIGDGLAVECTPAWDNCVQITAVGNIGSKSGYNTRTWTKHGKLPYVSYTGVDEIFGNASGGDDAEYVTYTVVSGDTLSGIGAKYGVSYLTIAEYNGISSPYTIYVGQVLKIPV